MNVIKNIARQRLPRPAPPSAVEQAAAREWAAGWWGGIAVGFVNGLGASAILWFAK